MKRFSVYLVMGFLSLLILSASCKKVETQVVSGNTPPKDSTVDNVLRDNYIQKLYIDVIGRAPTSLEKIGARTITDKNNCSVENRAELLAQLMAMPDFKDHIYNIDNAGLLNSSSDLTISYYVIYYTGLMNDTAQKSSHLKYVEDVKRLQILKTTYKEFLNDSIDLVEVQKRLAFNPIYDALIGGEFNWALNSFTYFLKRKPTTDETASSYMMLQGLQGQMLLKPGQSKSDMINIFFDADEYFEGQVRIIYLRYLYREPTTLELQNIAPAYHKNHDFVALLKNIFLSNEYLGIK